MMLTPHFALEEFAQASDRPLTQSDRFHAQQLAEKLEVVRAMLGVPLVITSFVRGTTGQHGNGTAVDVRGRGLGMTQRQLFDLVSGLADEGELGQFGQLIFYPFSDEHFHLSLATGVRRQEVLIADATETDYQKPTPGLIASIPGSTVAGLVLFALAGLALTVWRSRNA